MIRNSIFIITISLLASCQYFSTEKITSEEFYEEELNSIDWEDVDQYPAFSVCDQITEKAAQRICFVNTIKEKIYTSLGKKNLSVSRDILDTVFIRLNIGREGEISTYQVFVDSLLSSELPLLEFWLSQNIDSLPPLSPATKRGIPVATEFTLPVVIRSATD